MDVRAAILQRINERFMRLRAAFDQFNDASAERESVGPKWNVRDLAGHLAHWTADAAGKMAELAVGRAQPVDNIERTNEEIFRKNRRMSYVMLLPQLRQAEENLLTAVKKLSMDHLMSDEPARNCIDEQIIGHYDHHWPSLSAAVQRVRD